jgi:dehydrogenase/reductase SDR family member 12
LLGQGAVASGILVFCSTRLRQGPRTSQVDTPISRSFSQLPILCNTRTGYLKHVKSYYEQPPQPAASVKAGQEGADTVDLTGKVVVVTGANSGLGKQVATYAASKNARVYMLCRSLDRANAARDEIKALTDNEPTVVVVDVGELAQVRRAAQELQAKEPSIHALVCNAGVLLNDRQVTAEGTEVTFAAHLLGGSYLLTQLLLPQLKAAEGGAGRAIVVTSGGMYNFRLPEWDVLTSVSTTVPYNGVNVYAYAKRAQVLMVEKWAQTVPDVTFVTAHPGWADTNAVDEAFGDMKKYLNPLREPWEGAEGISWLLGAPKEQLESGALYLDRKPQPKHLAGPFFTEGSYTKNKPEEVDSFMEKLKEAAGL